MGIVTAANEGFVSCLNRDFGSYVTHRFYQKYSAILNAKKREIPFIHEIFEEIQEELQLEGKQLPEAKWNDATQYIVFREKNDALTGICSRILVCACIVSLALDVVLLIINSLYNCNDSMNLENGNSKYVVFDLNMWIIIACGTHFLMNVLVYLLGNYECGDSKVARKLFVCLLGVFVMSWSIIGFLLFSEMNGSNQLCNGLVLSWNIVVLIQVPFVTKSLVYW